MDWNALKIFKVIAECGSLSAASRRLNVSQPTLSRKLVSLEESLDSQLFQRLPKGLVLTEAGEKIISLVMEMEEKALSVEKAVTGQNKRLEGTVRLTTTEYIGTYWIPEVMNEFRGQFPGISVDLNIDMAPRDLLRREADIAVRLGYPRQPDLIARKLGILPNYMAASPAYIEKYGKPERLADIKDHYGIGLEEALMHHPDVWKIFKLFEPINLAFTSNSMLANYEAVSRGLGIGFFSGLAAEKYPDLVQLELEDVDPLILDVWLVTHADIQHNARIRALYDFLGDRMAAKLKDTGRST
ncbi:LysR family transcriptional regulator [Emcibacter sp.]|uniref:LysR family transcriptional regulator n=1 Tax=Emcibacter sp. TaxID=1979954 RepID=UPI002AA6497D|nr:LysR family transcriptional regulator [Emcibacter sp.]